jgi:hypothetical protein
MNQEQINLVLGILAGSPLVLYVVQQFFLRRKNKIDYGDDLLDVANKMAASLKEARAELQSMEQELRSIEHEHEEEIDALRKQQNDRVDRMKARVLELERTIVKYDVSFTLVTHPNVQVTDMKVVGKEDVMASQRMKAISDEKAKK